MSGAVLVITTVHCVNTMCLNSSLLAGHVHNSLHVNSLFYINNRHESIVKHFEPAEKPATNN